MRYRREFRKLFANFMLEAKIGSWCMSHILRHTFASLATQAGVSLFKIGVWMGHIMSEVTKSYAHLAAYDSDIIQLNGQSPASGLMLDR